MKIIDFDIEKAKSGEYEIVTKHGVPVRIICWDKQDGVFKLVGLVKDTDGDEFCQSYDEHGDAREGDTAFNLQLVCSDPVSELTDFEYKVGSSMYGSYIDEMNEEGLDCVRATARELLDLAKMELYDEAWFTDGHAATPDPELTDFEYAVGKEIYGNNRFVLEVDGGNKDIINGAKESAARLYELAKKQFKDEQPVEQENDGMNDCDKPTKMFIDELRERLELALKEYWRPSDKSGVCDIRYTIQDNVIYDCVGGTEMPVCDVVNVVVNALNHRNEYWDGRSTTIPNLKDVRYSGLERKDEIDVINKHITNTQLSDEINTRLNNCGWFVCDKNNIRGLIEYLAEIEKNM